MKGKGFTLMSEWTIGSRLALGFGIILLLVVIFGVVVYSNLADIEAQFKFVVEHDQPVISNAHQLQKLVLDLETGQRGYGITRNEEFLEPYNLATKKFTELMAIEKILVSDNPSQVKVLKRIEGLVSDWQEQAGKPEIAMARKIGKADVGAAHLQSVLSAGQGKGLMDKIRALCEELSERLKKKHNIRGEVLITRILKDMLDMETGERGFLITGKEEFLAPFELGKVQLKEDVSQLYLLLKGDQRSMALLNRVEVISDEWLAQAAAPEIAARRQMNLHPETEGDLAAMLQAGTGKNILDNLRREFAAFISTEEELSKMRYAEASATTLATTRLTVIIVLSSLLFGAGLSYFIISSVKNSLLSATETISDTLQEIGVTAQELTAITQQQAASVNENNACMATIRETSRQAAGRSKAVGQASIHATEQTREGQEVAQGVIQSAETAQSSILRMSESILSLSDQVQRIGDIVVSVNELSEQTKILALNASIEAARAGEEGKSFAVVATQIRDLANQSKEAGGRIGAVISEIQNVARESVADTREGAEAAIIAINEVQKLGGLLRK